MNALATRSTSIRAASAIQGAISAAKFLVVSAAIDRRRDTVHGGQDLDDLRDKCRLVALASIRHGRQKRAVGFRQQPIERHLLDGLPQVVRLREGQDSGDRNVEAEIEARCEPARPCR